MVYISPVPCDKCAPSGAVAVGGLDLSGSARPRLAVGPHCARPSEQLVAVVAAVVRAAAARRRQPILRAPLRPFLPPVSVH